MSPGWTRSIRASRPGVLKVHAGCVVDEDQVPADAVLGQLVELGRRFLAPRVTLASKARVCFLRPRDISHSSLAATAALSLGAGLLPSHLSSFLGPPQHKTWR